MIASTAVTLVHDLLRRLETWTERSGLPPDVTDRIAANAAWLAAEPHRWIGLGLIGVGLGAFVYQVILAARVRASRSWSSVPGVILAGETCIQRVGGELSGGVRGSVIRYGYEVDGRWYESDVVSLGGDFNTSGGGPAHRRLLCYPIGTRVHVYFNPAAPARACLERTLEAPWLTPVVGAVFIVIGAFLMSGIIGRG